ncbi:restriction endonuclease [Halobaculum sp. CBA1158]|uniref:restriction endonuclease n=1 Tax=Halobaculum sp. CBA1158 TaxID=2904243 RepID=UPI001F3BA215|nr:restriction endonuclease [Halobaculum sp. CBA1158]UIO98810.1 restriction endonuclease [Halobaculum sp. CBA1158]
MRHPAERLAALPDAEFAAFVERLGGVWPDWEATASPVSPDGTVELSLSRDAPDGDAERAVVRVRRSETTVEEVNDLAVFAAERGLAFAVLATVDDVSRDAAARARAAPVELYDGVGLVSLARDAGIDLPDADSAPALEGGSPDEEVGDDADPTSDTDLASDADSAPDADSDGDSGLDPES